ncbi:MAG: hypothetical protein ACRDDX_16460 [Cellulosilyticaceae bacterium]
MEKKAFYEEKWFWMCIAGIVTMIILLLRKNTQIVVCGNGNGEGNHVHINLKDLNVG